MTSPICTAFILFLYLAALLEAVKSCNPSKNETCATDVRAIANLGFALNQGKGDLRGWNTTQPLDPCGYSSCSEGSERECNYEGVACEGWRIVKIELDCNARPGRCGLYQRMTLPVELDGLSALTHLRLVNSRIAGTLPPWNNWPSLTVLNLSGNLLNGPLQTSWAGLTNLAVLDVSDNQLAGKLPGPWSSMQKLRTLLLGDNGLQGTIPPSWNQLNLSVLDVRNNCGLCGNLVNFGRANITLEGTNIGGTCHAFNCNSQFFAHIMIIVSLVFGALALCLLQRHLCMRCRNRRLRDRMAAGLIGQSAANQDGAPPATSNSLKLSELAVVVMPDGQTVAFGRKLSSDNLERSAASANNLKPANAPAIADTTAPADTTRTADTQANPLLCPGATTTITITRESDTRDTWQPPSIDVSTEVPGRSPGNGHNPAASSVSQGDQQARSWIQRRLSIVRPMLGFSSEQPPARPAPVRRSTGRSVAPTGVQVTGMRFDARGNPM